MDKTSCQCLGPPLHPEIGASSGRVALGGRAGVRVGLQNPRARQLSAGQGHYGRLPGGGGGAGSCWPGSQTPGLRLDPYKVSEYVILVTSVFSAPRPEPGT